MYEARVNHPKATSAPERGLTVLLFGDPGTRKTTWFAQWPGVVFLSISAEGGDDALLDYPRIAQGYMDQWERYKQANAGSQDPFVQWMMQTPPVFNTAAPTKFPVHTIEEMEEYLNLIIKNRFAWGVMTVVIDGVCFLCDLWMRTHFDKQEQYNPSYKRMKERAGGDQADKRAWGFWAHYLADIRMTLQNAGLNVGYTTLQKDIINTDEKGNTTLVASVPLISGQAKVTLPAGCKLWIHAKKNKTMDPKMAGRYRITPTYYVASDLQVDLRHKYYDRFAQGKLVDPDPAIGDDPTFRAVYLELAQFIYLGQG
jgi:hypothetical protein